MGHQSCGELTAAHMDCYTLVHSQPGSCLSLHPPGVCASDPSVE